MQNLHQLHHSGNAVQSSAVVLLQSRWSYMAVIFQIVTEFCSVPSHLFKLSNTMCSALQLTTVLLAVTRSQRCYSIKKLADLLHTGRNWDIDNTLFACIWWIDGQHA